MNLIDVIRGFKGINKTQYGQMQRLFQCILSGSLKSVVVFVTDELPVELVEKMNKPGPFGTERSRPGWRVIDMVRQMGLLDEDVALWKVQCVLGAGQLGLVGSISDPIEPPTLGWAVAGYVQLGTAALQVPTPSGVVNIRLDDLFARLLAEKRASLPPPTPDPNGGNIIVGPVKDHAAVKPE